MSASWDEPSQLRAESHQCGEKVETQGYAKARCVYYDHREVRFCDQYNCAQQEARSTHRVQLPCKR